MMKQKRWLRGLGVFCLCLCLGLGTVGTAEASGSSDALGGNKEALSILETAREIAYVKQGPDPSWEPKEAFLIPETAREWGILHSETGLALRDFLLILGQQLYAGNAESMRLLEILARLPWLPKEAILPPGEQVLTKDNFLKLAVTQGVREIRCVWRETEDPEEVSLLVFYGNRKGELHWSDTGTAYNRRTGLIYGRDGKGIVGYGHDFTPRSFMAQHAPGNQKSAFGFDLVFGWSAPFLGMLLETVRFPFVYDGKDWLIQFWKGQYFCMSNGVEIGLYHKDPKSPIHYDAATDHLLEMDMQLLYDGVLRCDYLPVKTWWAGSFYLGSFVRSPLAPARELQFRGSILFQESEILAAFWEAYNQKHPENFQGRVEGLRFFFDWTPANMLKK